MIKSKDEPIHQSVKNKIRTIALENNSKSDLIFNRLILERFLARLEKSQYKDNLIFKGGLCLSNFIEIGRETKDIDFLVSLIRTTKSNLKNIFTEISNIDLEDGFKFNNVLVEDLKNEKEYPGFRVEVWYIFGQAKNSIQIDIGIGDIVDSEEINFKTLRTIKSSLFLPEELYVKAYTPEFIFSEKLETAIKRSKNNSRMKDYHDMFMIIKSGKLNITKLKNAISKTFENRKTQKTLLPYFNFEDLERFQILWKNHRNQLTDRIKNQLPENFDEIYKHINIYLSNNNLV